MHRSVKNLTLPSARVHHPQAQPQAAQSQAAPPTENAAAPGLPQNELERISKSLLSLSSELERDAARRTNESQQVLEKGGTLENVAKATLFTAFLKAGQERINARTPQAARDDSKQAALQRFAEALQRGAKARNPAPNPASSEAPKAPATPPPFTGKVKQEYQGALQDQKVLEALMAFHKSKNIAAAKKAPEPGFAPLEIPTVEAAPKPSAPFRKGIALPVLRGSGGNGSGRNGSGT